MKRIFMFLVAAATLCTVNAQILLVDTVAINESYKRLAADVSNPERQREFFNAFPSDWLQFQTTYGAIKVYDEVSGETKPSCRFKPGEKGHNLYSKSFLHIDMMRNNMDAINDSLYCAKVVRIGICARPDVDTPSAFQNLLKHTMDKREKAMWKIISGLTPADQMSFWMFYWNSPFPDPKGFKEVEELYGSMSKEYPEEAALMRQAFELSYGKTVEDAYGHIDMKQFIGTEN